MKVIGQAHTLVHQNGVARVQTDIRIGTRFDSRFPTLTIHSAQRLINSRTDKTQHFSEKVSKVESILATDGHTVEKSVVTTEVVPEAGAAKEQQQAQGPGTNKGTWASMFRK